MCVHRESGAQRAVKVLRKSHMDDDEKRMLFNEINILKEIVSVSERSQKFNYISHGRMVSHSLFFNQFRDDRTTPTSSKCTNSSRTKNATTL